MQGENEESSVVGEDVAVDGVAGGAMMSSGFTRGIETAVDISPSLPPKRIGDGAPFVPFGEKGDVMGTPHKL